MTDQTRYAQRHDEHYPPKAGVEQKIMEAVGTTGECAPRELIKNLCQQGLNESIVRAHIWLLLDRGWLRLTLDRKFEACPERASPAPIDLV